MRIAAFDLGSTWACATNFSVIPGLDVFHVTHKGARPQKLGEFKDRVNGGARWNGWMGQLDVVVYERPFARGQAATRMLWGMAGILEAAAHNAGTAVLDFHNAEIKKWAVNAGGASKSDMLVAAQCLGYTGDNEHEADAWCLLKFAEATLEIE